MTKILRYIVAYVCAFVFVIALLAVLFEDGLTIKILSGVVGVLAVILANYLYRSSKKVQKPPA